MKKHLSSFSLALCAFLISSYAHAKSSGIDAQSDLKVQYGSSSWNNDSTKIESAALLVRDAKTGKMAQINLEESEPDSSIFSGNFRVQWKGQKKINPQIYIPPNHLRGKRDWIERVSNQIKSGKLKRKPFLFKKDQKVFEVFDTSSQAKSALKAYRQEKAAKRLQPTKLNPLDKESVAAKAVMEAAKLKAALDRQKRLALEAAQRESERIRMAQIERQKALALLKQQKALAAAEKKRRKKEAQKVAQQAMKKYLAGQNQEAVSLFEKSIQLDPENKVYYYQYGVALYKIQSHNKSIVILKEADSKQVNPAERNYYIALNHFRLQERKPAFEYFQKVRQANHKILSPSAGFYQGMIEFQQHQYEKAKPHFEYVLDTSEDPKLDERAEQLIERIASILFFAKQKETKFFLNATLATQYDSNILLLSNETLQQDTSTEDSGLRLIGIGGFKYRPVFGKHHEFSTDLDLAYYYSLDDAFSSADPFQATLSTPYTYKGKVWNKGYKLDVTPGYELLYMDALNTGSRDNILKSTKIDIDQTFVMSERWFAKYSFGFRIDDSQLAVTDAADDQSAKKYTLETTQTFILDKGKTRMAIGGLGFTINSADGANNNYFRYDLSASYIRPLKVSSWDLSWVASLSYYNQNYGDRDDNRKDNNFALSNTLSKPLGEKYSVSVTADYTNNNSNVTANTYNKYTIMTSFSANHSF